MVARSRRNDGEDLPRPGHIVVSRQHVTANHVQEIIAGHVFVKAAHTGRCRSIDDRRDVRVAPEPAIGTAGVWSIDAARLLIWGGSMSSSRCSSPIIRAAIATALGLACV